MIKNRSRRNIRSGIVKLTTLKAVTSVTVFFIPATLLFSISFAVQSQSDGMSLEQRVRHLEELSQTRNKVQAEQSYQLSELQREVRQLTGQVEENNFKLKQVQDRQRELYRDIENRLSGLTSQPSEQSNGRIVPRNNGNQTGSPASDTSKPVISENNGDARREFEAAFALVRNKKYTEAISAFDNFLNIYPTSSYSANARYWMGQVYLVQNKQTEASKQFKALITEFPSSTKISAAKLKMADIYLKQENWSDAKRFYTDVANSASGTQQQLARKGLDKIKQAGH